MTLMMMSCGGMGLRLRCCPPGTTVHVPLTWVTTMLLRSLCLLLGQQLGYIASAAAPVPAACGSRIAQEAGGKFTLKASPDTVKWGYFFESAKPALAVPSGSEVMVEMITHHAGDGEWHAPGGGIRSLALLACRLPRVCCCCHCWPVAHPMCVVAVTAVAIPDPDKLIKGDPAIEEIFKWTDKMRIQWRGASGTGGAAGKL